MADDDTSPARTPRSRVVSQVIFWGAVLIATMMVVLAVVEMCKWNTNDDLCRSVLGPGATWAGGSDCRPPPMHVDGLA